MLETWSILERAPRWCMEMRSSLRRSRDRDERSPTTSDLGDDSSWREALRDNQPLLVVAPAPATLNAGDHLYSRHRPSLAPVQTLSFAPVLSRTATARKAALTGRVRLLR